MCPDIRSEQFTEAGTEPSLLSPLTLAFVGDTVYELFVRESLATEANRPAGKLHEEKVSLVNASAQAKAFALIEKDLTDREKEFFKRGRNAHTRHTPKNKSSGDYHIATGFEALLGWLYLSGNRKRIAELLGKVLEERENIKERQAGEESAEVAENR